jgi:hypothetical protein
MKKKLKAILLILTLYFIIPAVSAWQEDGTAICSADNNQLNPNIISDGDGGAIIAWEDSRSGAVGAYAQRINSTGVLQWVVNGVPAGTLDFQICSDGAGGVIVVYLKLQPSGPYDDLYVQRIDSTGSLLWGVNGKAICNVNGDQKEMQICYVSGGETIVTWTDRRDVSNDKIYAQKLDDAGNSLWDPNGTAICTFPSGTPNLCPDGTGGAIIAWGDRRNNTLQNIYAQRINAAGESVWSPNGTAVCTADHGQGSVQIRSAGDGDFILCWHDNRDYDFDIYAQKIDLDGTPQWQPNGTAICTASETQDEIQLCCNGAGGAIIAWEDSRSGSLMEDVYAQKVNSSGITQWGANGTAISTADHRQRTPRMCSDNAGGAFITWADSRKDGTHFDIFVEHIDSEGALRWNGNGFELCPMGPNQFQPDICSDGNQSAFITWSDSRPAGDSNDDIYVQFLGFTAEQPPIPGFILLYLLMGLTSLCIVLWRKRI